MGRAMGRFVVLALLLSACGGVANPAGSGAAASGSEGSGGPGATAAGGSGEVQAWAERGNSVRSLAELEPLELTLVDEVARGAGLEADLGAETWAWAQAELHDELAKAGARLAFGGEPVLLASVGAMPPLPPVRNLVDGGAGFGLAMAAGLMTGEGGGLSNANMSLDTTETRTANGETTTGRLSGHIVTQTSGSTISADVEIGIEISVADATTGAVKRTGSFRSQGKIELTLCPDANGKVRGHVTVNIDGGTSGVGSTSIAVDAEIEGTVGEDAYLQTVDISGTTTQSSAGPSGSSPRRSVASLGMSAPVSRAGVINTSAVTGQARIVEESGEPLTDAEVDNAYARIASAASIAVWVLADKAQAQWRGGACVEIRATEQSREVGKNETVQFEARTWQKVEGVEIHKNIVGEFTGKRSADPVGVPVPSPMLVSFKAGPEKDDTGTVTLTSTSNRGIGTLSLTFTVKGGWVIDQPSGGGRIHGQKCGDPPGDWVVEGTYKQGGLDGEQKWTITIGADGKSGTFVYNTSAQGVFAGAPVTVYVVGLAYGNVTLDIDPNDGRAHMEVQETRHTYTSTTSAGGEGHDQNAALAHYTFDWEVGGNC